MYPLADLRIRTVKLLASAVIEPSSSANFAKFSRRMSIYKFHEAIRLPKANNVNSL